MAHYMDGPSLQLPKGTSTIVSFGDVLKACGAAKAALGEGYVVLPEPISEGGMVFYRYPGYHESGCKTIRFSSARDFPWISNPEDFKRLKDTRFELARWGRGKVSTFIKSFEGAPGFTRSELDAVMNALNQQCFDGRARVMMPQKSFSDAALSKSYLANTGSCIAERRSRWSVIPGWEEYMLNQLQLTTDIP
jgi:hypothetical protein